MCFKLTHLLPSYRALYFRGLITSQVSILWLYFKNIFIWSNFARDRSHYDTKTEIHGTYFSTCCHCKVGSIFLNKHLLPEFINNLGQYSVTFSKIHGTNAISGYISHYKYVTWSEWSLRVTPLSDSPMSHIKTTYNESASVLSLSVSLLMESLNQI